MIFRGTPYEHLTQGTSASLATITREDVIGSNTKTFTTNNLIIGIAVIIQWNDCQQQKTFCAPLRNRLLYPDWQKAEAPAESMLTSFQE